MCVYIGSCRWLCMYLIVNVICLWHNLDRIFSQREFPRMSQFLIRELCAHLLFLLSLYYSHRVFQMSPKQKIINAVNLENKIIQNSALSYYIIHLMRFVISFCNNIVLKTILNYLSNFHSNLLKVWFSVLSKYTANRFPTWCESF